MLRRDELNRYLDDLLETARFDDYAPNGLQVEGAEHISTLVTGVTASRALVDAALQAGAEALLVHHGYFWRGEDPRIVGMKRARRARAGHSFVRGGAPCHRALWGRGARRPSRAALRNYARAHRNPQSSMIWRAVLTRAASSTSESAIAKKSLNFVDPICLFSSVDIFRRIRLGFEAQRISTMPGVGLI